MKSSRFLPEVSFLNFQLQKVILNFQLQKVISSLEFRSHENFLERFKAVKPTFFSNLEFQKRFFAQFT